MSCGNQSNQLQMIESTSAINPVVSHLDGDRTVEILDASVEAKQNLVSVLVLEMLDIWHQTKNRLMFKYKLFKQTFHFELVCTSQSLRFSQQLGL